MNKGVIGEKRKEELVSSSLKPSGACKKDALKDKCDRRRWNGRTSEACYRNRIEMRKE